VRLLLLWDIDNTLVRTSGLDRAVYRGAARALLGVRDPVLPSSGAGRTEPRTMAELLALNGAGAAEAERLVPRALEYFRRGVTREAVAARGVLLPGAAEALAAFAPVPGVAVGVATGNVRAVAEAKLAAFGLDGLVDWGVSGCGDGADTKARVVALARERAGARFGTPWPAHLTVLVGDSPADARASSEAAVVGVATGRASARELAEAGAVRVLDGLRDTGAVVEAVSGAAHAARTGAGARS
jgi:phosphoglycolate phosphatase-like HAD superfamily hydrolase